MRLLLLLLLLLMLLLPTATCCYPHGYLHGCLLHILRGSVLSAVVLALFCCCPAAVSAPFCCYPVAVLALFGYRFAVAMLLFCLWQLFRFSVQNVPK